MIARIRRSDLLLDGLRDPLLYFSSYQRKQDFVLFNIMKVFTVDNESDEKLEHRRIPEDNGGFLNEHDSLAQQCFNDANDKQFSEFSNELV